MNYGDSGDEVTQVQLLLRALGYDVAMTGIYDQASMDAVRDWQRRLDLTPSGVWDQNLRLATDQAIVGNRLGGEQVLVPPARIVDPETPVLIDDGGILVDPDSGMPALPPETPDEGLQLRLQSFLQYLSLEELQPWIERMILEGRTEDEIRMEIHEQPAFQARFPAIKERMQRYPGQPPLTPREIIEYERNARQIMRAAGLPGGFWDANEDFHQLLVNDVSLPELERRLDSTYGRIADANPIVREAFRDFFGIYGDTALATLVLDPDKATPMLEAMAAQAEVAGAGRQQGFKINLPLAQELQRAGYTAEQAPGLFVGAAEKRTLTQEQVGEDTDVTETGLIKSEAGLAERQTLTTRAARRLAKTERSGGAQVTEQGQSLGAANR